MFFLIFSILPIALDANISVQDSINTAIFEYDKGNYKKVVEILQSVVSDTRLAPDDEINARTYLAFSYVALGNIQEAKNQFIIILKKKDRFSLNPEFVSPKIINVFNEAEKTLKKPMENKIIKIKSAPESTVRCLLKSSVFPGWGQLARGDKKKGTILIGAFSVSFVALALSHFACISAKDSYMKATTQQDIDYQYSRYNFAYKTRYIIFEVNLFVWGYSAIDILLSEPKGNIE